MRNRETKEDWEQSKSGIMCISEGYDMHLMYVSWRVNLEIIEESLIIVHKPN